MGQGMIGRWLKRRRVRAAAKAAAAYRDQVRLRVLAIHMLNAHEGTGRTCERV